MSVEKLKELQIHPEQKQRRQRPFWVIVVLVLAVVLAALFFAKPWSAEKVRRMKGAGEQPTNAVASESAPVTDTATPSANSTTDAKDDVVLTVSGYIIN